MRHQVSSPEPCDPWYVGPVDNAITVSCLWIPRSARIAAMMPSNTPRHMQPAPCCASIAAFTASPPTTLSVAPGDIMRYTPTIPETIAPTRNSQAPTMCAEPATNGRTVLFMELSPVRRARVELYKARVPVDSGLDTYAITNAFC